MKMRYTGRIHSPVGALGVIGFPVGDYYLSLFHGAVRYRQYRCNGPPWAQAFAW